LAHWCGGRKDRHALTGDDVTHLHQPAAQAAGRMKPGEVFLVKAADGGKRYGQRITDGERGEGRAGRSEVVRADLFLNRDVECHVDTASECGVGVAHECDRGNASLT